MTLVWSQSAESVQETLEADFNTYYRTYYASALVFVRERTGGHYDPEGIVADAFLLVWVKAKQTGHIPDQPWLYRVLRNRIGDWYRRKQRIVEVPVDRALFDDVVDLATQEENYEIELAREVLNELDANHRESIVLYYWAGQNCAEAAEIKGIGPSIFKKRLSRARKAFSNKLLEKQAAKQGEHNG